MSEFKLPTEVIELPSKGLLYPEDSELAKGTVEMKYMTAKEEDILTNQSYIKNGTVLDKLMKSLIVSPIKYEDLLLGDKKELKTNIAKLLVDYLNVLFDHKDMINMSYDEVMDVIFKLKESEKDEFMKEEILSEIIHIQAFCNWLEKNKKTVPVQLNEKNYIL
jgi:hypothetical protein